MCFDCREEECERVQRIENSFIQQCDFVGRKARAEETLCITMSVSH